MTDASIKERAQHFGNEATFTHGGDRTQDSVGMSIRAHDLFHLEAREVLENLAIAGNLTLFEETIVDGFSFIGATERSLRVVQADDESAAIADEVDASRAHGVRGEVGVFSTEEEGAAARDVDGARVNAMFDGDESAIDPRGELTLEFVCADNALADGKHRHVVGHIEGADGEHPFVDLDGGNMMLSVDDVAFFEESFATVDDERAIRLVTDI